MPVHDPRRTLAHIANLAHSGGLAGLSQDEAMNLIRRLTLPYWANAHGGSFARVSDAIRAARGRAATTEEAP